MIKTIQQKLMLGISLVFLSVTAAVLLLGNWLDANNINHFVLVAANVLMFLLAALSLLMHTKALQNKNPNVFVRSVMASTFIKLMVILAAVIIYMVASGTGRSVGAVVAGMGLYIIYTILEVRGALKLNRLSNGK